MNNFQVTELSANGDISHEYFNNAGAAMAHARELVKWENCLQVKITGGNEETTLDGDFA